MSTLTLSPQTQKPFSVVGHCTLRFKARIIIIIGVWLLRQVERGEPLWELVECLAERLGNDFFREKLTIKSRYVAVWCVPRQPFYNVDDICWHWHWFAVLEWGVFNIHYCMYFRFFVNKIYNIHVEFSSGLCAFREQHFLTRVSLYI